MRIHPSLETCFLRHVIRDDITGCWNWIGARSRSDGYGQMGINKKKWQASHVALLLEGTDVPSGMHVTRVCGNCSCVNPEHLILENLDVLPKIPLESRFWHNVSIRNPGECWEWLGSIANHGYGELTERSGKVRLAHRLSWEYQFGPIPKGMFVCHTCDNHSCVNPHHLFLGTNLDNTLDKVAKGRQTKGVDVWCSKLKPDQVVEIRKLYSTGNHSQNSLGRKYNVSAASIRQVVLGISWKQVE